jgi:1-phosphatidylinositol phosphodiesterase
MRNRSSRTGAVRSVAIGVFLSLSLAAPGFAHPSPGYAHDARVLTRNPNWLGKLKDDVRLSQLSLPGTHDTMSFFGGDAVQTQTLSLPNQLLSGIRVLDIRCRHVRFRDHVFAIVHGSTHQNAFFGDVLDATVNFLRSHPRETVFMRVKEEGTPENVTQSFDATFRLEYWSVARWRDFFWKPGAGDRNNPTLGEIRGKIVVLQNFPGIRNYGVDYTSFNIQDEFVMRTNWDLYDKWIKVQNHLRAANTGAQDVKYMNYLSASRGSFPYFVASGHSNPASGAPRLATGRTTPGWRRSWPDFPRVNCFIGICTIAFEGTNILTYERLQNFGRVGVIMSDFPGPGLIDKTIARNDRYKS